MTAAAAASLSRSRGPAGVRSTKGLFFISTLLCLVCLASSLTDKDQLEIMKAKLHKHQQMLNSLKEESQSEVASSLALLDEYKNIMGPLAALMPDIQPLQGFLLNVQGFLDKFKPDLEIRKNKIDAEIEAQEEDLAKLLKLIQSIEERQAEL